MRLHGTRLEMVESFLRFLHYRENVEGKLYTAVKNDFKAVKALARYRGIPNEVWPKPPPLIKKAREVLPKPEDIHALLHTTWVRNARNSYEQHLLQYLLVLDFGYGVRFPSEAFAMRVQDLDPKQHTIVVREPKKSNRTRRLYIEPEWLCCGKNRPSLVQYLRWRAKVDIGGTDAFFLKPDGQPFPSKEALTQWIVGRVQSRFPWYYGYLGRTWCANARLIEWGFDYERVADWLGHESVDMTRENYEKDARIHAKMYGTDWLERAFVGARKSERTVE